MWSQSKKERYIGSLLGTILIMVSMTVAIIWGLFIDFKGCLKVLIIYLAAMLVFILLSIYYVKVIKECKEIDRQNRLNAVDAERYRAYKTKIYGKNSNQSQEEKKND